MTPEGCEQLTIMSVVGILMLFAKLLFLCPSSFSTLQSKGRARKALCLVSYDEEGCADLLTERLCPSSAPFSQIHSLPFPSSACFAGY